MNFCDGFLDVANSGKTTATTVPGDGGGPAAREHKINVLHFRVRAYDFPVSPVFVSAGCKT